jgi:uncharacterized protein YjiS (DUF1127 family)
LRAVSTIATIESHPDGSAIVSEPLLEAKRTYPAASKRPGGPGRALARMADGLLAWLERRRGRRALMGLDDAQLRDIGLSRADVEREWNKPFWRE